MLFPLLFFFLLHSGTSASTCGSLISYRQYSALLENAPACLRNGCGGTDSANSMSSSCPSQAPCSGMWNLMKDQSQKDWCSTCEDDVACRISGWPVMNATALCDMSPKSWIFGDQGTCCTSGDEPFQLAAWVGSLCNGSEWRALFNHSGWMATEDWEEWILPWNWTVAPLGTDSSAKVRQAPVCSKSPWYLGLFFIENMIFLAGAVAFAFARLWLIKRKERKALDHENRDPWKAHVFRTLWHHPRPLSIRNRDMLDLQPPPRLQDDRLNPGWFTRSFLGPYLPLLVGTLLAGLQVLLNMASAYIIRHEPGYSHIPVARLGLLFCSRPRLTWFACVLGIWRDSIPARYFKLRNAEAAARAVLAGVAVSSTISEGIMQVLGTYYMGITANTGREKGFYPPGHLTPYIRGHDARHLYLGALFWLIACVPIILIWPVLAFFSTRIFHSLHKLRMRLPRVLPRAQRPHQPEEDAEMESLYQQRAESEASLLQQRRWVFVPDERDFNLLGFDESELNGRGNSTSGPGNMQQLRVPRPGNSRSGVDRPFSVHSDMLQELGHQSSDGSAARRTGGGLRGGDGRTRFEYHGVRQVSGGSDHAFDHRREPGSRNASGGLRGGAGSIHSDYSEDDHVPDHKSLRYEEWQGAIIALGLTIGLISYAAQWMFWDGYVKAAGPKFCHPRLLSTGTLWAIGSILSSFFPFALQ